MKASNLGKIFSILLLLSLSSTYLSADSSEDHYYTTNITDQQAKRVNTAVDDMTKAYNRSKEIWNVMQNYTGTDPQKIALFEKAKNSFTTIEASYTSTMTEAKRSVSSSTISQPAGLCNYNYYTDNTYSEFSVRETERLSQKGISDANGLEEVYCEFNSGTWANGVCKQSSSSSSSSNNDTVTTLQTISDNTQTIITNTTNGGNGGSCTPTYNHITHSYDCI